MTQQVLRHYLPTLEHSRAYAQALASALRADDWLLLEGQMGAGKTTLVRFLVGALGGAEEGVSSPSYALMNSYAAALPLWHIDAWRLQGDEDFAALGVEDFAAGGVVLVEWPSRVPTLGAMSQAWQLQLEVAGEDKRWAELRVPPVREIPPALRNDSRNDIRAAHEEWQ